MLYQIKSYLNHQFRAYGKHKVHSPFVYHLITQCFQDNTKYPAYATMKKHRKLLLQSQEQLTVTDLGAGSRVFKSDLRKVAAIAKNAGITRKRQQLLYRLVHYLKPKAILELGTSLGMATVALAWGNPEAKIVTVEGCPNTAAKAQELFHFFNLKHIQLKNQTFEQYFSQPLPSVDLVYIDGNHNGEQTLQYFEQLLKHVTNDSVLIFDDIYWSPDMTLAWQKICAHPKVTVSIDTFQWGLIFFRREQEKQHFRIRM